MATAENINGFFGDFNATSLKLEAGLTQNNGRQNPIEPAVRPQVMLAKFRERSKSQLQRAIYGC